MAQAGFTPISLYFSTTAAAVPTSANLVAGELALNTVDEKLYFKNSAGTVKLLASNATSAPVLSFSAGTTGFTPNTATTGVVTLAGTLATTNGGTGLTSFTSGGVVYASSSSVLATGSGLVFDGSNLGVGVASPAFKLEVATGTSGQQSIANFRTANATAANNAGVMVLATPSATAASRSAILLWDADGADSSGGDYFFISKAGNSGNVDLWQQSNAAMTFLTNGTERARITSGGDVGIGTSSPAYKLDVNGNAKSSNYYLPAAGGVLSTTDSINSIYIAGTSSNFTSFTNNSAERMRITSAGLVGIGTTTPTATLDVTSATIGYMNLTGGAGTGEGSFIRFKKTTTDIAYFGTSSAILGDASNNFLMYTNGAVDAVFLTNAVERARISSAGQFLVNTTTGYGKFTVASTAGTGKVLLDNYASVPTTENVMSIYADATNGYIQSYNNGYKNICLVHNGGNVGIGTASPTAAQLVIKGDGATTQIRLQATTNTNQGLSFIYNYSGGYGQINCDEAGVDQKDLWYTALNHKFGRNTSSATMTHDSSGNLVIGATSASTKLDVVKQGNSSGGTMMLSGSKTNSATKYGYMTGAHYTSDTYPQGVGIIGCTALSGENKISIGGDPGEFLAATQITFWTAANSTTAGGSERMRLTSAGKLGIGISSPDARFDVENDVGTDVAARIKQTSATNVSQILQLRANRNTTNDTFYALAYYNDGASAYKLFIADSGNVTNTNNSYGAISDVKLKENIVDASPKLADLMQVKVRNYNLIGDTTKQLGVVAQELETVFPAMVNESPDKDGDGNNLGTKTKQVKYSVFVPMLIKAIQEQQAIIESLKARLDAANL